MEISHFAGFPAPCRRKPARRPLAALPCSVRVIQVDMQVRQDGTARLQPLDPGQRVGDRSHASDAACSAAHRPPACPARSAAPASPPAAGPRRCNSRRMPIRKPSEASPPWSWAMRRNRHAGPPAPVDLHHLPGLEVDHACPGSRDTSQPPRSSSRTANRCTRSRRRRPCEPGMRLPATQYQRAEVVDAHGTGRRARGSSARRRAAGRWPPAAGRACPARYRQAPASARSRRRPDHRSRIEQRDRRLRGSAGSQTPQSLPIRGTPPDEPQPRIRTCNLPLPPAAIKAHWTRPNSR